MPNNVQVGTTKEKLRIRVEQTQFKNPKLIKWDLVYVRQSDLNILFTFFYYNIVCQFKDKNMLSLIFLKIFGWIFDDLNQIIIF